LCTTDLDLIQNEIANDYLYKLPSVVETCAGEARRVLIERKCFISDINILFYESGSSDSSRLLLEALRTTDDTRLVRLKVDDVTPATT
jgi:hypothetical protein